MTRSNPALNRPAPQKSGAAWWAVLPAAILIYSALIPPEVRINIADQTFYATRMAAVLLLPWLISQIVKRPVRLMWLEYVFFAGAFWMVFAFIVYYGPGEGLPRGGALAFDVIMPYLIARYSIRSSNDVRRMLIMVAPGLLFPGLAMLAEIMTGTPIIRPAAASIFGALPNYENGVAVGSGEMFIDHRLGLLRAAGPFPHPIMAGLFLASFLSIYAMSSIRRWPVFIGIASAFFAVFTISSSAIIALLIALGLMAFDKIQRMVAFLSWKMTLPFIGLGLLAAHFYSQNGLINVLIRFTLNPQTGQFRRLIWEYGTQSVARNPWFGIGFTDYERPEWMVPSVDNHWLLLAMRFGIFPSIAFFTVAIGAIWLISNASKRANEQDKRFFTGIAIAIFALTLLGFTVAFFGGPLMWFNMLLAICVSLHISTQQPAAPLFRGPLQPMTIQGNERRPPYQTTPAPIGALPKVQRRAPRQT